MEENVRRKDLLGVELSKNITSLAETAAKIDKKELRLASKRNSGRPEEAGSLRRVAERIGVSPATIVQAQKHVAAVARYPELAAPGIPQKDAITIARNLDALRAIKERCEFGRGRSKD